uniref:NB-ARC domain-containing protein n=1 Tax=Oryza brachyantha TaxID=4533 RepID=J3MRN6_ORYBR
MQKHSEKMAETAILLAIKKISIAVAGEILSLSKPMLANNAELVIALPTNMELVKDELEIINAFLKSVNTRGYKDEILETWMSQVRRLAYDIEDIVDQFIYVVGEHQGKGFWSNFKKVVKKPKDTLTEWLYSEHCSSRIIAVCGMGGLGKSCLVYNVFKRERTHFDCSSWISVSQSYKMDDILRNMLNQLRGKRSEATLDVSKMGIEGSRLIITTRIDEVAAIAEDACKIKLEPLSKHDSWILFCKKVFWRTENHAFPPELQKWGENIVNKCEGLPLAIVALGSLLSLRDKTEAVWKCFHDQIMWELQNNPEINHVEWILNLSYRNLPNYLKNCFLYCAMFPEDHLLRRKKLIRLWVAEGFVEHRGSSSLEEVAESLLRELVHRSMLQW